jgi:hypothetical protein
MRRQHHQPAANRQRGRYRLGPPPVSACAPRPAVRPCAAHQVAHPQAGAVHPDRQASAQAHRPRPAQRAQRREQRVAGTGAVSDHPGPAAATRRPGRLAPPALDGPRDLPLESRAPQHDPTHWHAPVPDHGQREHVPGPAAHTVQHHMPQPQRRTPASARDQGQRGPDQERRQPGRRELGALPEAHQPSVAVAQGPAEDSATPASRRTDASVDRTAGRPADGPERAGLQPTVPDPGLASTAPQTDTLRARPPAGHH